MLPARLVPLEEIGRHSLVIYLVHTRFLYDVVKPIVEIIHRESAAVYAVTVLVTLALSYFFSLAFMWLYQRALAWGKARLARSASKKIS
jgi:fucose 4-O-acetylase-like acetyltransferase